MERVLHNDIFCISQPGIRNQCCISSSKKCKFAIIGRMIFGRIGVNTQIHMDLCRGVTHQDNPEDRRTVTKPWSIVGVSLPGGRVTRCMTMDYNSRWDMVNTESEERASERALWQLWVLAASRRPAGCVPLVGRSNESLKHLHTSPMLHAACLLRTSISFAFILAM